MTGVGLRPRLETGGCPEQPYGFDGLFPVARYTYYLLGGSAPADMVDHGEHVPHAYFGKSFSRLFLPTGGG